MVPKVFLVPLAVMDQNRKVVWFVVVQVAVEVVLAGSDSGKDWVWWDFEILPVPDHFVDRTGSLVPVEELRL